MWFKFSLSLSAVYGAVVVAMAAAISHLFSQQLDAKALAALQSSTAILAFQTLALFALSLFLHAQPRKALLFIALGWHLGLWLFVYTVWAGIFVLPLHFSALAPLGGQLLIGCWLLLALTPWFRK